MLFLVGPDEGVQLIRCIGADLPDYTPEEVASFSGFATTRTVRATGRPLLIQDTAQHPMWTDVRGTDSIRSWIGAPLIHRGQFLGVLNLNANEPAASRTKTPIWHRRSPARPPPRSTPRAPSRRISGASGSLPPSGTSARRSATLT